MKGSGCVVQRATMLLSLVPPVRWGGVAAVDVQAKEADR